MTHKERLEKLIEQVRRLERIAEEIREMDIYPVSFFSQAFDIMAMIQEDIRQLELLQLELVESQKKQLLKLFSQEEMAAPVKTTPPVPPLVPQSALPPVPQPAYPVQEMDMPAKDPPLAPSFVPPPAPSPAYAVQEIIPKTVPPPPAPSPVPPPVPPLVPQSAPPPVPPPSYPVQEMDMPKKVQPPAPPPVKEDKKVIQPYLFDQKSLIDLKKVITLNDRFLFCRELFGNNESIMNQVFSDLNMEESLESSVDYLQKRFSWDFEDKNVTDFIAILKKRFS